MGFWDFFSAKLPQVSDDFFGEMLFVKSNTSAESYFECKRNFKPIGEDIELGIDGSLAGPTRQQKDFFKQLEEDYFALIPVFIPCLEAEFSRWMKLPLVRDFEAEFQPVYLHIPACAQPPIAWEISFETVHDLNHTVTIGLLGHAPQYVRIDG